MGGCLCFVLSYFSILKFSKFSEGTKFPFTTLYWVVSQIGTIHNLEHAERCDKICEVKLHRAEVSPHKAEHHGAATMLVCIIHYTHNLWTIYVKVKNLFYEGYLKFSTCLVNIIKYVSFLCWWHGSVGKGVCIQAWPLVQCQEPHVKGEDWLLQVGFWSL